MVVSVRRRGLWLAGLVLLTTNAAAESSRASEILVAAAMSLREPLVAIARRYEAEHADIRIAVTFGASGALAAQVRSGAPIDVFVSADLRRIDDLEDQGQIDGASRITLARNRLVAVVSPDAAASIDAPEDLLRPEIRVLAIPEPTVPLGAYARNWLRRRKLLDALERRIVPTPDARATLAAVDSGTADAALVYATDARLARRARVAFVVPAGEQPDIRYEAARVSGSRDPGLAADFLRHLAGDRAQATFRDAGFEAP